MADESLAALRKSKPHLLVIIVVPTNKNALTGELYTVDRLGLYDPDSNVLMDKDHKPVNKVEFAARGANHNKKFRDLRVLVDSRVEAWPQDWPWAMTTGTKNRIAALKKLSDVHPKSKGRSPGVRTHGHPPRRSEPRSDDDDDNDDDDDDRRLGGSIQKRRREITGISSDDDGPAQGPRAQPVASAATATATAAHPNDDALDATYDTLKRLCRTLAAHRQQHGRHRGEPQELVDARAELADLRQQNAELLRDVAAQSAECHRLRNEADTSLRAQAAQRERHAELQRIVDVMVEREDLLLGVADAARIEPHRMASMRGSESESLGAVLATSLAVQAYRVGFVNDEAAATAAGLQAALLDVQGGRNRRRLVQATHPDLNRNMPYFNDVNLAVRTAIEGLRDADHADHANQAFFQNQWETLRAYLSVLAVRAALVPVLPVRPR
jgi:hypothetical protein